MLFQQFEVALILGHQLDRDPDIAEGFAVAQVIGDDVGIESMVGKAGLGSGVGALCGRLLFGRGLHMQGATAQ